LNCFQDLSESEKNIIILNFKDEKKLKIQANPEIKEFEALEKDLIEKLQKYENKHIYKEFMNDMLVLLNALNLIS